MWQPRLREVEVEVHSPEVECDDEISRVAARHAEGAEKPRRREQRRRLTRAELVVARPHRRRRAHRLLGGAAAEAQHFAPASCGKRLSTAVMNSPSVSS